MNNRLFNLLHLTDPTLPIGGFSHSSGLETYVQQNRVKDVASAKEFIEEMLSENVLYNDAYYVSFAFEACLAEDFKAITDLDQHCNATKLPKELRSASQKLGIRLLKIFKGKLEHDIFNQYIEQVELKKLNGHYPLAFGIISAAFQLEKEDTLLAFLYNATVGFVTNCVKLIPLGQKDGQALLMDLQPLIEEITQKAIQPKKEKLGLCSIGFDVRSMQHEKLYSRLYMS